MSKKRYNTPSKPYWRERESSRFCHVKVDCNLTAFIKDKILPHLNLKRTKLPQKQRLAVQCILNLRLAALRGRLVRDTRDNSKAYLRIQVWDALIEAGFCRIVCRGVEGVEGEYMGYCTRYKGTSALWAILDTYTGEYLDYRLARNTQRKIPTDHALLVIHTGKRDPRTGRRLPQAEQKNLVSFKTFTEGLKNHFVTIEDKVEYVNRSNLSHSWQAFSKDFETGQVRTYQPNPCLRCICPGGLGHYAGLHSWSPVSGQNLTKEERRQILIDSEPVTELDFSAYHLRRHYHLRGVEPGTGDLYRPELVVPEFFGSRWDTRDNRQVIRKLVKKATNIGLNTGNTTSASQSINYEINQHPERELIWDVLQNFGISANVLMSRIIRSHPDISHAFFSEWMAPLAASLGAWIMLEILHDFARAGKPALGIHDSVVCKRSDRSFAHTTMTKVYRKWCQGFAPSIRQPF